MNVLLVHNYYQQAGGEDQVFAEEGRLLESRGHKVGRFTVHNDAVEGMGRLELARKTVHNGQIAGRLAEAARDLRADVVHFHNTFPLISPAAYRAARDAGAAVVQTLHNYRLLCPAATFYRDGRVCEECLGRRFPWPGVMHKCYRGSRAASLVTASMLWVHRMRRTWLEQVDVFIALTEFARGKLIEGGLPGRKICVKPNFVDPDPGMGPGEGGYALFVGRLAEEKGIQTLLDAWSILYPRTGVGLKVVGDGPLRQKLVDASPGASGVEYLGRRSSEEVYRLMGSAAALIFPSVWYEGQPRTIIESLAKGTPVVASRLGSMPELIEEGRTGALFTPGNATDLAEKADRIVGCDGSGKTRIRREARLEYESCYTATLNYPMLMRCYEMAVGRTRIMADNTA